ncbi:MAG: hypothetical protein IJX81_04925 [Clostridia bacterium]|nr:hypothetical protein [Clostridia bacterium]
MGILVSKKSLVVSILHFLTAAFTLIVSVLMLVHLFSGNALAGETTEERVGFSFAAIVGFPCMLIAAAGYVVSVSAFVFSGVRLMAQAQGELPSKRSFLFTLVVKCIAFALGVLGTVMLFVFPNGGLLATLSVIALALSFLCSISEAYVRRCP